MKNLTEITIKYFNRQELFTKDDIDLVMNIILDLDPTNKPLLNMMYGLFDGYLYNDLLIRVSKAKEIPSSTLIKFNSLIKKIETNINK